MRLLVEANTERIKKIDSEMKDILNKINVIPSSIEKDSDEKKEDNESNPENKKCRYYDKGYCKYQKKCIYFQALEIC